MGKWVHRLTQVDAINSSGVCANCGLVKLYWASDKGRFRCSVAAAEHRGARVRSHGLNAVESLRLKKEVGSCEICGLTDISLLRIDHDHADGSLRGILCNNCNVGLGLFKDDLKLLRNAIKYLSS
jgi:hypothetical protein